MVHLKLVADIPIEYTQLMFAGRVERSFSTLFHVVEVYEQSYDPRQVISGILVALEPLALLVSHELHSFQLVVIFYAEHILEYVDEFGRFVFLGVACPS